MRKVAAAELQPVGLTSDSEDEESGANTDTGHCSACIYMFAHSFEDFARTATV